MERTLAPEWLDTLPAHEPAARRSRRDIAVINRLMGNGRWLEFVLSRLACPGEAMLEVGAGDGDLARRLPRCDGLDLSAKPAGWPGGATWHQGDALTFSRWRDYPVVFGSLVFHHFNAEELALLGAHIRRHARVFVACEPARGRGWQWLFAALCPLMGAGAVTRHDGWISIGAGFGAHDLPRLLGFSAPEWHCAVRRTWRGAYRFIALRS